MRFQKSFSALVAATALAIPVLSLSVQNTVAQTPTQNLTFRLTNRTNSTLRDFYASPAGVDNWEQDILGADTLIAGDSINITIADGRKTCVYDIKGIFMDGESVEDYRVNLCNTQSYEFFNRPVRALW